MPERKASLVGVTDEQQIRQAMEEWRRLTAAGNLDGLLSLLSDDVIFLTPGNPPITKEDFAKGFRDVSAKAEIESVQQVKEVRTSGDVAVAWSHLTVVLRPKDGGKPSEASGYVLTVFHRSPAGTWLLARDANLVAGAGKPDRV
jgi:uncharacterized protein (TIGR02246 family)